MPGTPATEVASNLGPGFVRPALPLPWATLLPLCSLFSPRDKSDLFLCRGRPVWRSAACASLGGTLPRGRSSPVGLCPVVRAAARTRSARGWHVLTAPGMCRRPSHRPLTPPPFACPSLRSASLLLRDNSSGPRRCF